MTQMKTDCMPLGSAGGQRSWPRALRLVTLEAGLVSGVWGTCRQLFIDRHRARAPEPACHFTVLWMRVPRRVST